jgi:hypothetical protein
MTRKVKTLGLALSVVLAATAVSAAGAQAVEFQSEAATTFLHGEQKAAPVFDFNTSQVKCTTATFSGKMNAEKVKELTINPKYEKCTYGVLNSPVTFKGLGTTECDYTLLQPTGLNNPFDGKVKFACLNSTDILLEIPAAGCSFTIEANQEPPNVFEYENQGTKGTRDILVTSKLEGIKYKILGPTANCGTIGETRGDGRLTGSVTLKGYRDAALTEQAGIWAE